MTSKIVARWIIPLVVLAISLGACAPAQNLPPGPTPIPTLIPVSDENLQIEPTERAAFTVLSYPAELPDASEGKKIYDDLCAECHGPDGMGVVPEARNFRDLDYMRGETPAEFYSTVTEGRGEMPGYAESLTSDERWDVVFFVWRLSTTRADLQTGQRLYDQHCSSCHGGDGSGKLLGSADFTDLRQMDNLAPRDLYLTVTQGRGSMPAWQSVLNQDERWEVIDYVRTFTYEPELPEEVGASEGTQVAGQETPAREACDSSQSNPLVWDDSAVIEAGAERFQDQCALCHGKDGSGGLPNTPDFTSNELQEDLRANPGSHYCTLSLGTGAMPGYAESLSPEEMWQLITFLGSLGR
jgi:mono/diheme cytochrome c family protein